MANEILGRLLVVDDEVELMRALSDTLVEQNYEVVGKTSGPEGLEALAEQDFDLLLSDLGKRSPGDSELFAEQLARATAGRFQLSTAGYTPYRTEIPNALGFRVDYARLVKVYGFPEGEERRYSPPQVIAAVATVAFGNPDMDKVCTSHVERHNLTARMTVRRMTRLTNAFSKMWENHEAAMALFFAYYNYCRPLMTLNAAAGEKTTPAMASGLTDHVWTVAELAERAQQQTDGAIAS